MEIQDAQETLWQKTLNILPIERVVAFILTPLLAVASPWLVKLMATWYPGTHLTTQEVSHLMIVTVAGIILLALKWLHGRQNPALIHTANTVLAAVKADPALLSAVSAEIGGLGGAAAAGDTPLLSPLVAEPLTPREGDPPIPPADMPPPGTTVDLDGPAVVTGAPV